jgi:hypothetical protein
VDELRVDVMITIPSSDDENGRPFWITKVVNLSFQEEKITLIIVHWLCTTSSNSFCGIYKPESINLLQQKSRKK